MSAAPNYSIIIDDPDYAIGNSQTIHRQIKEALIYESDANNANRTFLLQSSNVPQAIQSDLHVDGNFTSGSMSTAGFDVNGDGTVDFTSDVTFQFGSLVQDFIHNGYVDLSDNQTVMGTKTFDAIRVVADPIDSTDLTNKAYVDTQITTLSSSVTDSLNVITDDITTINSDIVNLNNSKQDNLTINSINDNWLSNNIPRYDITNIFTGEVVCQDLTVVSSISIGDATLNKSKIIDLNSDLSAINSSLNDLDSSKQPNLTSNSIQDSWLSSNVVLNNSNQTFSNDVTVNGVLYAENMTVTNLTTINQTSTDETITNLTVDDLTVNGNLVMGVASTVQLLDSSVSIAKITDLQTALDSKASNTDLTTGLDTKQNTIADGDLIISHVTDLATQLNSKVPYDTYATGLGTKQNTIQANDLAISHILNLQTALDSKASSVELSDGLALKQNVINDSDLTIARTSGLQTALDSKANLTQTLYQNTY